MKRITAKFPGAKILVADDYEINLELTREMLEMMECTVDTAEDGAKVLELYQVGHYDLIFMDLQMPEVDGYDATRRIREMEGNEHHTPIIAITANTLTESRDKCVQYGMDDYVSKPIRGENLENILYKYLKTSGKVDA